MNIMVVFILYCVLYEHLIQEELQITFNLRIFLEAFT